MYFTNESFACPLAPEDFRLLRSSFRRIISFRRVQFMRCVGRDFLSSGRARSHSFCAPHEHGKSACETSRFPPLAFRRRFFDGSSDSSGDSSGCASPRGRFPKPSAALSLRAAPLTCDQPEAIGAVGALSRRAASACVIDDFEKFALPYEYPPDAIPPPTSERPSAPRTIEGAIAAAAAAGAGAATVEIRSSSTPSSRISLLPGAVVNITVYLPSLVMRTIRALQYPSPLRVTRTLSPSRSAEPPVADDDAPPLPLQRKSQMVGEMLGGQKC